MEPRCEYDIDSFVSVGPYPRLITRVLALQPRTRTVRAFGRGSGLYFEADDCSTATLLFDEPPGREFDSVDEVVDFLISHPQSFRFEVHGMKAPMDWTLLLSLPAGTRVDIGKNGTPLSHGLVPTFELLDKPLAFTRITHQLFYGDVTTITLKREPEKDPEYKFAKMAKAKFYSTHAHVLRRAGLSALGGQPKLTGNAPMRTKLTAAYARLVDVDAVVNLQVNF